MRLSLDRLIGRKTLILGEIGSGKNRLLAELIGQCISKGLTSEMTILDFSPPATTLDDLEVGGKISDLVALPADLNYVSPKGMEYPGLKAGDPTKIILTAKRNASLIEKALNGFISNPTKNVFISEISLFFHFGDVNKVREVLNMVETAVLTGYYGFILSSKLKEDLHKREKMFVEALSGEVNVLIYLPPPRAIFEDPHNTKTLTWR